MQAIVKSHYTAPELAMLGLPGVPTTEQGVRYSATRENWEGRRRAKGKGLEYALDSLPTDAQVEIRRRASAALVASIPAPSPKAVIRREQQLQLVETDMQRLCADARKGILSMLERIMTQCRVSREAAMHTLLTQARLGTLDDCMTAMLRAAKDPRGRKGDEFPSIRSLKRYLGLSKKGSLAPKVPKSNFVIPEWAVLFLEHYQQPQKPSVGHAYREFEIACAVQRVTYDVPSIHQVRRFLDKLGTMTLQTGRMGSRELKTMLPFIRRTFDKLLPNDIWSGDGHTFDAEVQHPLHGRPFRPEITSIIDVATRRAVGISLDLAESSFAVLDALSTGVLKHGVPSMFYVDNGSGYKNALLKDEGIGVQGRLGFVVTHSIPYNSQARGVIERLHKTLWVAAAKKLPSYMGADMDRQARHVMFKITRDALKHGGAMPLMGWDVFIQFCQEQVDAYNARPHSTLPVIRDPNTDKRRHMSPNEAWAAHVANGWQADTLNEHDARLVFRPRIKRTVARGEVRFLNHHYSNPVELLEFHDEEVQVAYDINDARYVWIYALDGRYICRAEAGANERDYMPQSAVEQAREKRADARANRLQVQLDEVEAERRGHPALTLETPEVITITGFGDITRDALNRRFVDVEPVIETEPVAPMATEPETATVFQLPETSELRFARWQALHHHIETGGLPDQDELQWYGRYALSKEFAAQKRRAEQAEELPLASHQ